MTIFIPKPEPIEAYRWLKNGDMPGDGVINNINSGKIIGRHPTYKHFTGDQLCPRCGIKIGLHGVINKRIGDLETVVCPGDWVVVRRDTALRILGYTVLTDKILRERYIDIATLPIPKSEPVDEKPTRPRRK